MAEKMQVSNPRRILAVSLETSTQHLTRVIKDLTGTNPEQTSTSLAGTTHDLSLKTAYYTATVPIWLDLITSPADWAASFLSPEAKEVLGVLGGLVLVFAVPPPSEAEQTRQLINHVGSVVKDGLGGWQWEGVGIAVGVGQGEPDEWDEACAEVGLEFVQLSGKEPARNEFGEKTGIARVREALEANDWAQLDEDPDLSDFGDFEDGADKASDGDAELDPENLDFGFDKADFEGLRRAIWQTGNDDDGPEAANMDIKQPKSTEPAKDGDGTSKAYVKEEDLDDEEVLKLEKMMHKLQAVREAGEGMSQEQRRRMAARAVQEVMKDM